MPRSSNKPTTPEISPLTLLRKIRDAMARPESAQARLDRLVKVIAHEMGANVCSVYLLREGNVLELFASEGLKKESVHLTRLQVGEGLVGEIAAQATLLNLADAPSHPKFVFKPETGEEIYHAFVGIPILQTGNVVGVLVVQNKDTKIFTEDQIEVLQTVAMVLAELNDSGKLVSQSEISQTTGEGMESLHLTGLKFAPGIARAPALLHRKHIEIKVAVTDNPSEEILRLEEALIAFQASIDRLIHTEGAENDERMEILETYRMFAHDKGWINQIAGAIESGLTAEAAVRKVQEQLHARMSQVSSEYIKERMQDLEDVSTRLQEHLSGGFEKRSAHPIPDEFILIAGSIGPAEFLEYGRRKIKGLVLEEGSATSHIVVIARALEIPVVGRVPDLMSLVHEGDPIVVDGDGGDVYVRPTETVDQQMEEHMAQQRKRTEAYEAMRPLPPISKDGLNIELFVNAGLFVDVKHLSDEGVHGIGLYRTELPYMISTSMPDVASQEKIYSKIIRQATGKRVIFRTFDIGGDKQLPYFPIEGEENPAMGWRATRIGLDRPAILRRQLRALVHAASGHALDVMFPFITQASEIEAARRFLTLETTRAKHDGFSPPSPIRVGAMLEVPSLLWQLPQLAKQVDFISIGSNDLLQFFFACDRGSLHVGDRYDPLSPEVLRMLRDVVVACDTHKVELSFCGEMGRKPLEALALIAIGLRKLSLPTSALGPVKAMIRTLDIEAVTRYMKDLLDSDEPTLRSSLEAFARDHGVETA